MIDICFKCMYLRTLVFFKGVAQKFAHKICIDEGLKSILIAVTQNFLRALVTSGFS